MRRAASRHGHAVPLAWRYIRLLLAVDFELTPRPFMHLIPKPLAVLIWSALVLSAIPLPGAVVTANFTSATTVPVTAASYTATGNTVNITLSFTPQPGTILTVVKNTGLAFIQGTFDNLAQGQSVSLSYGGITYPFVANYFGGTGNDLVLLWGNVRLLAWGADDSGQLGNNRTVNGWIPTSVESTGALGGKTVIAMSTGMRRSLALCSDGTLAAWGDNAQGAFGNGTTISSLVPVAVPLTGALSGKTVIAIAAGPSHSLGLCTDGTLAAWGYNFSGELGNNSNSSSPSPVLVYKTGALLGKTVVAIAAGWAHSLALCSDGSVVTWGRNYEDQLGIGSYTTTTTGSNVPVAVNTAGVLSGKTVTAIAAGYNFNLVLCADGSMAGWGENYGGQLGNSSTSSLAPFPLEVDRTGVLANKTVTSIAAGSYHSLALCSDGTLTAWGGNSAGALGNNSLTKSSTPVLVDRTGVLADKTVVAISGSYTSSMALCADGSLVTWGENRVGQLGNNSTVNSSTPVLVDSSELRGTERFVAAYYGSTASHGLALMTSPAPPTVTTLAAVVVTDTGATLQGTVNANGSPTSVSFEYGLTSAYGAVAAAIPGSVAVSTASAATATLNALLANTTYHFRIVASSAGGTVRGGDMTFTTSAFASLSSLSLGSGSLSPAFASVIRDYAAVMSAGTDRITVTPVTASATATVMVNGTPVASGGTSAPVTLSFGNNAVVITVTAADGTNIQTYTITVTRLPLVYRFESAGAAPVTVPELTATGNPITLELGYAPPTGADLTVVNNTGLKPILGSFAGLVHGQRVVIEFGGVSYKFVANYFGGSGNDLVLLWEGKRLMAWGRGTGSGGADSSVPVDLDMTGVLSGKTVIGVSTGASHSLAVCSDGTVAAWGNNQSGSLGDGTTTNRSAPTLVLRSGALAGKTVVAVAAGGTHSLALCSDGTVAAWGGNGDGQLGISATGNSSVPVWVDRTGVLAGRTVTTIAAGDSFNVALCTDGKMVAWGLGYYGQLGNGTTVASSWRPVMVDQTGVLAGKLVTAISAAGGFSLALCADGTLAAWGDNNSSQLGIYNITKSSVPVLVEKDGVLAGKRVVGITAGWITGYVRCSDGTVAAWGYADKVPRIVNLGSALQGKTVISLVAGEEHRLVYCSDGTLAAWGDNSHGQLGNGTTTNSTVPVLVGTGTMRADERMVAATCGPCAYHNLAWVAAPPPPGAMTLTATAVSANSVTLQGRVNAAGSSAAVSFDYGLTAAYGTTVAATPATVTGTTPVPVSVPLTGLIAGTIYHYRVVATSASGTTYGADMTFTPTDDPDGDNYDSLIEYAFNLPPDNGAGSPFSINPSTSPTGRVEFSFTRPVGATASVTYYLEYSSALGPATSWIPIPLNTISPRNIDVAAIDALTERVTVRNFEAREGFVRFRVELDANGDRITDHISYTGVEGWTESTMKPGTRTYNNPYQHEAVFTGTVDATGGVSGQTLHFATSAGSTDLGTLLVSGASHYLEVTAGPNEGQRFDVAGASGSALTLAAASDVCSDTPPFGTLAGAPPATLAGNRIALHRHWSLGELFPVGRFLAAGDDTTADQVQTSAVAATNTYWLYANGGSPKWVRLGDATLADQGNTVLAPGRGLMVLKRGTATSVLAYGGVRANNFVRPLCAGPNLVGGGWPIIQSATGTGSRQMDAAHGFFGSTGPASADTFSVWKGDATRGATAYDNYYLYNSGTTSKWVRTGDATLTSFDAEPLFLGDRSVLVQVKNNLYDYTILNPLNAATPHAASVQSQAAIVSGQDAAFNLIDYAFGLQHDPNNTGQLPQGKLVGDNYVIDFTQPTGVTGITYGAECSATLLPGSWTEVPDSGSGTKHIFSVPVGTGGKLFMRLRVTGQ